MYASKELKQKYLKEISIYYKKTFQLTQDKVFSKKVVNARAHYRDIREKQKLLE